MRRQHVIEMQSKHSKSSARDKKLSVPPTQSATLSDCTSLNLPQRVLISVIVRVYSTSEAVISQIASIFSLAVTTYSPLLTTMRISRTPPLSRHSFSHCISQGSISHRKYSSHLKFPSRTGFFSRTVLAKKQITRSSFALPKRVHRSIFVTWR